MSTEEIFTPSILASLEPGTSFEVPVCLGTITPFTGKSGGEFVRGTFRTPEKELAFIAFSGIVCETLKQLETGNVVLISGEVNEYNNTRKVKVNGVNQYNGELTPSDFERHVYQVEEVMAQVKKILHNTPSITPSHIEVVNLLVQAVPSFVHEYAAPEGSGYHDNVPVGLLAHSFKCLSIAAHAIDLYPEFSEKTDVGTLLIGTFLHDFGKAVEYSNGAKTLEGNVVSHRTFGIEILAFHRERIIEFIGIDGYRTMQSIVAQHHGEYEEHPRTVEALFVHLVDHMEATLTSINQGISDIEARGYLYYDNSRLSTAYTG